MDEIKAIAAKHGLAVIEGAAQAIGAEYHDGRRASSMGTVGCLSFFPSKNLGALGDGGMVVTNDQELAERMKVLRVHGGKPKYYHKMIGGNFRFNTIQAAVLKVKLNYLDEWTTQRQENARRYETIFQQSGLVQKGKIRLPDPVDRESGAKHYHIYNQFVLRVEKRDDLIAYLRQKGIGTEIYYPVPFHLCKSVFDTWVTKREISRNREKAAKETVAIPIYPELTAAQQGEVVEAIASFFA